MYELFRLNNNLRVAAEKIEHVNSICVGLWIENGSRNENEKNNGISHFIEHMFFKGTINRTSKELAKAIEEVGGQINAFTGKEATCFYIKVLNTHFELALEVLSDMLFNSNFNEDDIEKEKSVINEEILMTEDSPEDILVDVHSKSMWGEDSISLPILGTKNTISTFDRKTLKEYVSEYYIPDNSVISICGNFDEKNINKLVEKYFGSWKCGKKRITKYSTPSFINQNLFKEKDIEQIQISMGIKGIEIGNDDIYSLAIICNLLGGGASSVLFQKLREELGLCYSIYAYSSSLVNTGAVTIYSAMNPSTVGEAISTINEEVNKFISKGISAEELRIAKEQLKGSYILGLESTSSRMFSNGRSALFLNKINTPNDILHKINSVNGETINRVMDKTFKEGIISSAFVGSDISTVSKVTNKPIKKV